MIGLVPYDWFSRPAGFVGSFDRWACLTCIALLIFGYPPCLQFSGAILLCVLVTYYRLGKILASALAFCRNHDISDVGQYTRVCVSANILLAPLKNLIERLALLPAYRRLVNPEARQTRLC